MRRAILFSLDALLASMLLIAGLLIIAQISDRHTDTTQMTSISQDTLGALAAVKLSEMQNPWVTTRIANGTIVDANETALEQIGYLWALGQTADAQTLASILLEDQYPEYGMRLTFDGIPVYERNGTRGGTDVISSSRLLSGIAAGEAVTGSSAVAYLRRIKDKRTLSFTTFGGFVGQGNISINLYDLPSDANITSISLELATGAPVTVFFNGVNCGTYTPTSFNGTPSSWDISTCNSSLIPGSVNLIHLNFSSDLNVSYVAGGFLKVKYKTSTLATSLNSSFVQYHFPGIRGILNLYDAFYVPGTLKNMTVYLHYNVSNSTYLDIGEKRVWLDNPNGTERIVILNDTYLRDPSQGRLDYDFLSNKTIPLRMAGFTPSTFSVSSGDADVVIITDFSGSMKKAVGDWSQGNLGSNCENAYADSSVRRTLLAQCVDNNLVNEVMNYSGNRVWPVFIYDDKVQWYNNPDNKAAINGYINSFSNGKGQTCYACALNLAHDILQNFSNSSRKKFIVFMSDGCPTHCASGSCVSNSTIQGAQQCAGMCDTSGACDASNIPGQCAECTSNPGGQLNAYYAANRSASELDVTIYTIGFGPVNACAYAGQTLQEIAQIGNGTYQHSNNSQQLKLIYENISQEIISKTSLVAQLATVVGPATRSELYGDSYINITYDLASQYEPTQNTISLTLQTPQACSPIVPLYAEQQLVDVKTISYSGTHWSDYLAVNDVEVYNLSNFLVPYDELGDPTIIQAPVSLFTLGNNTVTIQTGDSAINRTGCFVNDSVIYTVVVNLSTERSTVVPNATGCLWYVEFEDNTFDNITIPAAYTGTKECSYRRGNITYDPGDAYQLGAYTIFNRLDFKKDGTLFVNLRDEDLEVIVTTISQIPYMWGPSIVRLEVTR
jgi:hypothetical protein